MPVSSVKNKQLVRYDSISLPDNFVISDDSVIYKIPKLVKLMLYSTK